MTDLKPTHSGIKSTAFAPITSTHPFQSGIGTGQRIAMAMNRET